MKEFTVKTTDPKDSPSIKIKAETAGEAYRQYLANQGMPNCPVLVELGGMFGYKTEFKDHLNEGAVRKEQEEIRERREKNKKHCLNLSEKIKQDGFSSLSLDEVSFITRIIDQYFVEPETSIEEFELTKAIMSDELGHRYFSHRSNSISTSQMQAMLQAMNVNLSNISDKTSGVKIASMFTGMAAARHLGEEIAEDFGGGDE